MNGIRVLLQSAHVQLLVVRAVCWEVLVAKKPETHEITVFPLLTRQPAIRSVANVFDCSFSTNVYVKVPLIAM